MAEIIHHYVPRLVDLHNYSAAHSVQQKKYNWMTLNKKVYKKMGFQISSTDIEDIVNCVPETVERVIKLIQSKIIGFKGGKLGRIEKPKPYEQPGVSAGKPVEKKTGPQQWELQNQVDTEILIEKEQTIQELRETIEIMELKIKKLEQLVRLKDSKIQTLTNKLAQAGIQQN
eukprot:TRINITY_DN15532_c0_g1_i2.p1 TRINITY_DN15532_c0_g1~~TRINITY_DN15532_c0_g1_i2.p1  ORF type:complete len:172 (-),score=19.49 TRINITY_DN15532_c0_g1_i2:61-576(-)